MALVLHQEPQELTPAYNDQIFTALSDQIAVSDFKYVVTVIVNGDTANTYTEDILPRPDGWLVFNAKQWVKNYIEHYFEYDNINLVYPIEIATNKTVSVEVNISEYYTATIQSTDTTTYEAFDACLTDEDFRTYDFADYLFNTLTGTLRYFLSKDINTITPDSRIALNQPLFLHFINGYVDPINSIAITLRRGGSQIDLVSIATLPTPTLGYNIYQLYTGTDIFSGATPQVGDIVRVDFLNSVSASILRWSYTVQEICTKYTDYVIYYLDRDGNILPFHFEMKSKKNHTKKINSVALNKDVLNTTTGAYGSTTYDREEHIISTATESTIELNTNWLTQLQIEQLKDLFDSPIVYIWDYDTLRSCKVTNLNFEEYQINNEPLNVLNITVDLGITETRQRGI
jgi:hypothetical protein